MWSWVSRTLLFDVHSRLGLKILGSYWRGVPSATALFSSLSFVFAVDHGERGSERE
jgi:hypothetical protein